MFVGGRSASQLMASKASAVLIGRKKSGKYLIYLWADPSSLGKWPVKVRGSRSSSSSSSSQNGNTTFACNSVKYTFLPNHSSANLQQLSLKILSDLYNIATLTCEIFDIRGQWPSFCAILLPRDAMLSVVYAVVVCLCVCACLSHSGIVSKLLNVGSCK